MARKVQGEHVKGPNLAHFVRLLSRFPHMHGYKDHGD